MGRIQFLTRVLLNSTGDKNCPYCGDSATKVADRKYAVLQLRQCNKCSLRFRWPKQTEGFSKSFYQDKYKETGFTTDLPNRELLQTYIDSNFAGSPKDFASMIAVLKELLPNGRVLDYGCSWGYGTFQLRKAGYDAIGFEISAPRAELGRKELGVQILEKFEDLDAIPDASYDGIYCAHVLEHLQSLKEVFRFFARILRPGGIAMVMVPNCGGRNARELGTGWGPMIGEKHTLALDGQFFEKNMPEFGFKVLSLSDPYDAKKIAAALDAGTPLPAEGEELMIVARRT